MSTAWQMQLKDPSSRLKHMFETKVLSDCNFLVGNGNSQVLVAGHKSILSAASPVLHDKLKATGGDQPQVTLTDVEPEVFQQMLKYIYLNSVDLNSSIVYDLAAAAKTYQMPQLLKICLDYIASNLSAKNVLQAYSLALYSSESDELKNKCEEIIKTNTKAVLSDNSFEEACPDVVLAVFSLESLEIDSELDLLNAADRYAKHVSKCNKVDDGVMAVRKILEKIRFLSLTPEQFAKGRATTTVLSASDACAILANIAYDQSGVPMPTGFSLRKDPRRRKASVLPTDISDTKFTIQVPDIANWVNKKKNENAWSSNILLHGLKWSICVQTDTKDSKKFLGVYAYCNWDSDSDTWNCKAEVEFSLLRADNGSPLTNKFTREFRKSNTSWGYSFIEYSKLLDPNMHYVKDGAITLQVSIKADKPGGL